MLTIDYFPIWYKRLFDYLPLYMAASNGQALFEGRKVVFDNQASVAVFRFLHECFARGYAPRQSFQGDVFIDGRVMKRSLVWEQSSARPSLELTKPVGRINWVLMVEQYFNRKNGENLVLNRTSTRSGQTFWYEVWPHVLFYALVDRYPNTGKMETIMKTTADRWYDACYHMGGKNGAADFDHTAFDFNTMQPVDNGKWKEPDAAAGIGWPPFLTCKLSLARFKFSDKIYDYGY